MLKILRCLHLVWTAKLTIACTLLHWMNKGLYVLNTLLSVSISTKSVYNGAWTCGYCWAGLSLAPGVLWLSPKLCGLTSWLSSTYSEKAVVLTKTRVLNEMAKLSVLTFCIASSLSGTSSYLVTLVAYSRLLELIRSSGTIITLITGYSVFIKQLYIN